MLCAHTALLLQRCCRRPGQARAAAPPAWLHGASLAVLQLVGRGTPASPQLRPQVHLSLEAGAKKHIDCPACRSRRAQAGRPVARGAHGLRHVPVTGGFCVMLASTLCHGVDESAPRLGHARLGAAGSAPRPPVLPRTTLFGSVPPAAALHPRHRAVWRDGGHVHAASHPGALAGWGGWTAGAAGWLGWAAERACTSRLCSPSRLAGSGCRPLLRPSGLWHAPPISRRPPLRRCSRC